ncbi:MAG: HD domain-containing phosphohydrolase [Planctomycetota bacterium]
MVPHLLRKSTATIICFVGAQAVALAIGWFVIYNATYERIAESVGRVIIDNNRRVAQSLVDAIGTLPNEFDAHNDDWKRAQQLVESVSFGSGGFACILDENGYIACHPDMHDDPSLRGVNLSQHLIVPDGTEEHAAIGQLGRDQVEVGLADFDINGKHYVATRALTSSGTRLLVHQPVSGLSAASGQVTSGLLIRMGLAGTPILLLTATIGIAFIRSHSRAVREWNCELEETVAQRTEQLTKSRCAIVTALATLADYRDNETGQHVLRISEYTVVIARFLQSQCDEIDEQWIERIRLASMLHDIGKVGVPDVVLRKPGKLTDEEFAVIKSHPSFGTDTLIKVHQEVEGDPLLQMAAEISLYHHERWDATGYPVGLGGEDIPLSARITAVADVFDAQMSPRVYKPAMPLDKVRAIIVDSSGTHFDPRVVDAFIAVESELCLIREQHAEPESAQLAA